MCAHTRSMLSRTEEDIKREQFIPFLKKKRIYKKIRIGKNRTGFLHRAIWEKHHKASLLPWADVHHINGIHTDNRPDNLEAMMHTKHTILHRLDRRKDMSNRKCSKCGSSDTKTRITRGRLYTVWYKKSDGFICVKCYRIEKRSQT